MQPSPETELSRFRSWGRTVPRILVSMSSVFCFPKHIDFHAKLDTLKKYPHSPCIEKELWSRRTLNAGVAKLAKMSSSRHRAIGFIGLGAMGAPMVSNLAQKLPANSTINVHDVIESVVDEVHAKYPDTILKCSSAKEVAENSVWSTRVTSFN
jgi:hypothetical protein